MRNRGNALFLILIAVALFAALSYAITQSGKGGGGNVSKEKLSIQAAQIVQMAGGMRAAADRMLLSNVTTAAAMTLHNGTACAPPGSHVECTSGQDCLFSSDGGGATPPNLTADITPYDACYSVVGDGWTVPGVGTAAGDALWAIDGISAALCTEINRGLGITGIPADSNGADTNIDPAEVAGKATFCFSWGAGANDRSFIQVLVEN